MGLFGTDGVRGIANSDLTPELAFRIARAGAHLLGQKTQKGGSAAPARGRLLVGRDPRTSGDLLEAAVVSGVLSAGFDVACLGIVTTPLVAYLVRHAGASGGVMISASHNPPEYNGIKFIDASGFKLFDEVENEIEALVETGDDVLPRPVGSGLGRRQDWPEGAGDYIDYLAMSFPRLDGFRVVLDAANGAASRVAPEALRRLGATVHTINEHLDGLAINVGCGSLHPESMAQTVVTRKAHAGFAFDGDGDRVIAADEQGRIVDGDAMMAITGLHLLRQGRLPGNTVVATVMSNLGLDLALGKNGGRVKRTKVGDRYVLKEMLRGRHVLGGEQSGHIIFLNHNTTGDGLLTSLELLNIMRETGRPLSELAKQMERLPQSLVNVRVRDKESLTDNREISLALKEAERELGREGRVLVRASGTEPVVRVMVEGRSQELAERLARDLAGKIQAELGDSLGGTEADYG